MNRWIVVALAVGLQACGPEREIRKKVDFVCRYVSFGKPTLDGVPEAGDVLEIVRKDDVDFLRQKDNESGGLVAAVQVAMRPVLKAVATARVTATSCEILNVTVNGDRATATLRELSPNVGGDRADGFERLSELSKLESHAARVSKANEWFEKAEKLAIEHRAELIKTEAGWRVDLQLPEKQKAIEEKVRSEASAKKYLERSLKELGVCNVVLARELLQAAQKLVPGNEDLGTFEDRINAEASNCIGGKWRRAVTKDPMTDDIDIVVSLISDNEIKGRFEWSSGTLIGRCSEKRLELYLSTEVMLDDTYDVGIVARHRFNDEKAARVIFSRSTSYQGAFFRNPREWLGTLSSRHSDVLSIEVPVFQSSPVVYRFTLAGADKAMGELQTVCGK